ncbi:hypothetical protein Ahia01_001340500 [Argonauta hians]
MEKFSEIKLDINLQPSPVPVEQNTYDIDVKRNIIQQADFESEIIKRDEIFVSHREQIQKGPTLFECLNDKTMDIHIRSREEIQIDVKPENKQEVSIQIDFTDKPTEKSEITVIDMSKHEEEINKNEMSLLSDIQKEEQVIKFETNEEQSKTISDTDKPTEEYEISNMDISNAGTEVSEIEIELTPDTVPEVIDKTEVNITDIKTEKRISDVEMTVVPTVQKTEIEINPETKEEVSIQIGVSQTSRETSEVTVMDITQPEKIISEIEMDVVPTLQTIELDIKPEAKDDISIQISDTLTEVSVDTKIDVSKVEKEVTEVEQQVTPQVPDVICSDRDQMIIDKVEIYVGKEDIEDMLGISTSDIVPATTIQIESTQTQVQDKEPQVTDITTLSISEIKEKQPESEKVKPVSEVQPTDISESVIPDKVDTAEVTSVISTVIDQTKTEMSPEKIGDIPIEMVLSIESKKVTSDDQLPTVTKTEQTYITGEEDTQKEDIVLTLESPLEDTISVKPVDESTVQISISSTKISATEEIPVEDVSDSVVEISKEQQVIPVSKDVKDISEITIISAPSVSVVSTAEEQLSEEEFFHIPSDEEQTAESNDVSDEEKGSTITVQDEIHTTEDVVVDSVDHTTDIQVESVEVPKSTDIAGTELQEITVKDTIPSDMVSEVTPEKPVEKVEVDIKSETKKEISLQIGVSDKPSEVSEVTTNEVSKPEKGVSEIQMQFTSDTTAIEQPEDVTEKSEVTTIEVSKPEKEVSEVKMQFTSDTTAIEQPEEVTEKSEVTIIEVSKPEKEVSEVKMQFTSDSILEKPEVVTENPAVTDTDINKHEKIISEIEMAVVPTVQKTEMEINHETKEEVSIQIGIGQTFRETSKVTITDITQHEKIISEIEMDVVPTLQTIELDIKPEAKDDVSIQIIDTLTEVSVDTKIDVSKVKKEVTAVEQQVTPQVPDFICSDRDQMIIDKVEIYVGKEDIEDMLGICTSAIVPGTTIQIESTQTEVQDKEPQVTDITTLSISEIKEKQPEAEQGKLVSDVQPTDISESVIPDKVDTAEVTSVISTVIDQTKTELSPDIPVEMVLSIESKKDTSDDQLLTVTKTEQTYITGEEDTQKEDIVLTLESTLEDNVSVKPVEENTVQISISSTKISATEETPVEDVSDSFVEISKEQEVIPVSKDVKDISEITIISAPSVSVVSTAEEQLSEEEFFDIPSDEEKTAESKEVSDEEKGSPVTVQDEIHTTDDVVVDSVEHTTDIQVESVEIPKSTDITGTELQEITVKDTIPSDMVSEVTPEKPVEKLEVDIKAETKEEISLQIGVSDKPTEVSEVTTMEFSKTEKELSEVKMQFTSDTITIEQPEDVTEKSEVTTIEVSKFEKEVSEVKMQFTSDSLLEKPEVATENPAVTDTDINKPEKRISEIEMTVVPTIHKTEIEINPETKEEVSIQIGVSQTSRETSEVRIMNITQHEKIISEIEMDVVPTLQTIELDIKPEIKDDVSIQISDTLTEVSVDTKIDVSKVEKEVTEVEQQVTPQVPDVICSDRDQMIIDKVEIYVGKEDIENMLGISTSDIVPATTIQIESTQTQVQDKKPQVTDITTLSISEVKMQFTSDTITIEQPEDVTEKSEVTTIEVGKPEKGVSEFKMQFTSDSITIEHPEDVTEKSEVTIVDVIKPEKGVSEIQMQFTSDIIAIEQPEDVTEKSEVTTIEVSKPEKEVSEVKMQFTSDSLLEKQPEVVTENPAVTDTDINKPEKRISEIEMTVVPTVQKTEIEINPKTKEEVSIQIGVSQTSRETSEVTVMDITQHEKIISEIEMDVVPTLQTIELDIKPETKDDVSIQISDTLTEVSVDTKIDVSKVEKEVTEVEQQITPHVLDVFSIDRDQIIEDKYEIFFSKEDLESIEDIVPENTIQIGSRPTEFHDNKFELNIIESDKPEKHASEVELQVMPQLPDVISVDDKYQIVLDKSEIVLDKDKIEDLPEISAYDILQQPTILITDSSTEKTEINVSTTETKTYETQMTVLPTVQKVEVDIKPDIKEEISLQIGVSDKPTEKSAVSTIEVSKPGKGVSEVKMEFTSDTITIEQPEYVTEKSEITTIEVSKPETGFTEVQMEISPKQPDTITVDKEQITSDNIQTLLNKGESEVIPETSISDIIPETLIHIESTQIQIQDEKTEVTDITTLSISEIKEKQPEAEEIKLISQIKSAELSEEEFFDIPSDEEKTAESKDFSDKEKDSTDTVQDEIHTTEDVVVDSVEHTTDIQVESVTIPKSTDITGTELQEITVKDTIPSDMVSEVTPEKPVEKVEVDIKPETKEGISLQIGVSDKPTEVSEVTTIEVSKPGKEVSEVKMQFTSDTITIEQPEDVTEKSEVTTIEVSKPEKGVSEIQMQFTSDTITIEQPEDVTEKSEVTTIEVSKPEKGVSEIQMSVVDDDQLIKPEIKGELAIQIEENTEISTVTDIAIDKPKKVVSEIQMSILEDVETADKDTDELTFQIRDKPMKGSGIDILETIPFDEETVQFDEDVKDIGDLPDVSEITKKQEDDLNKEKLEITLPEVVTLKEVSLPLKSTIAIDFDVTKQVASEERERNLMETKEDTDIKTQNIREKIKKGGELQIPSRQQKSIERTDKQKEIKIESNEKKDDDIASKTKEEVSIHIGVSDIPTEKSEVTTIEVSKPEKGVSEIQMQFTSDTIIIEQPEYVTEKSEVTTIEVSKPEKGVSEVKMQFTSDTITIEQPEDVTEKSEVTTIEVSKPEKGVSEIQLQFTSDSITIEQPEDIKEKHNIFSSKEEIKDMLEITTSHIVPETPIQIELTPTEVQDKEPQVTDITTLSISEIKEKQPEAEQVKLVSDVLPTDISESGIPEKVDTAEGTSVISTVIGQTKPEMSPEKISDIPVEMVLSIESKKVTSDDQLPIVTKTEQTYITGEEDTQKEDIVLTFESPLEDTVSVKPVEESTVQISISSTKISATEETPVQDVSDSVVEISKEQQVIPVSKDVKDISEITIISAPSVSVVSTAEDQLSEEEFFDIPSDEEKTAENKDVSDEEKGSTVTVQDEIHTTEAVVVDSVDHTTDIQVESVVIPKSADIAGTELQEITVKDTIPSDIVSKVTPEKPVEKVEVDIKPETKEEISLQIGDRDKPTEVSEVTTIEVSKPEKGVSEIRMQFTSDTITIEQAEDVTEKSEVTTIVVSKPEKEVSEVKMQFTSDTITIEQPEDVTEKSEVTTIEVSNPEKELSEVKMQFTSDRTTSGKPENVSDEHDSYVSEEQLEDMLGIFNLNIEPVRTIHTDSTQTQGQDKKPQVTDITTLSISEIKEKQPEAEQVKLVSEVQPTDISESVIPDKVDTAEVTSVISTVIDQTKTEMSPDKISDIPVEMVLSIESKKVTSDDQLPTVTKTEQTYITGEEDTEKEDIVLTLESPLEHTVSVKPVEESTVQISISSTKISATEETPVEDVADSVVEISKEQQVTPVSKDVRDISEITIISAPSVSVVSTAEEQLSEEEFFDIPSDEEKTAESKDVSDEEKGSTITVQDEIHTTEDVVVGSVEHKTDIQVESVEIPKSTDIAVTELQEITVKDTIPSDMMSEVTPEKPVEKVEVDNKPETKEEISLQIGVCDKPSEVSDVTTIEVSKPGKEMSEVKMQFTSDTITIEQQKDVTEKSEVTTIEVSKTEKGVSEVKMQFTSDTITIEQTEDDTAETDRSLTEKRIRETEMTTATAIQKTVIDIKPGTKEEISLQMGFCDKPSEVSEVTIIEVSKPVKEVSEVQMQFTSDTITIEQPEDVTEKSEVTSIEVSKPGKGVSEIQMQFTSDRITIEQPDDVTEKSEVTTIEVSKPEKELSEVKMQFTSDRTTSEQPENVSEEHDLYVSEEQIEDMLGISNLNIESVRTIYTDSTQTQVQDEKPEVTDITTLSISEIKEKQPEAEQVKLVSEVQPTDMSESVIPDKVDTAEVTSVMSTVIDQTKTKMSAEKISDIPVEMVLSIEFEKVTSNDQLPTVTKTEQTYITGEEDTEKEDIVLTLESPLEHTVSVKPVEESPVQISISSTKISATEETPVEDVSDSVVEISKKQQVIPVSKPVKDISEITIISAPSVSVVSTAEEHVSEEEFFDIPSDEEKTAESKDEEQGSTVTVQDEIHTTEDVVVDSVEHTTDIQIESVEIPKSTHIAGTELQEITVKDTIPSDMVSEVTPEKPVEKLEVDIKPETKEEITLQIGVSDKPSEVSEVTTIEVSKPEKEVSEVKMQFTSDTITIEQPEDVTEKSEVTTIEVTKPEKGVSEIQMQFTFDTLTIEQPEDIMEKSQATIVDVSKPEKGVSEVKIQFTNDMITIVQPKDISVKSHTTTTDTSKQMKDFSVINTQPSPDTPLTKEPAPILDKSESSDIVNYKLKKRASEYQTFIIPDDEMAGKDIKPENMKESFLKIAHKPTEVLEIDIDEIKPIVDEKLKCIADIKDIGI